MSGYEYGNTRLRAMKSRLITRSAFINMTSAKNVGEVLLLLSQSSYKKNVEWAMSYGSGMAGLRMLIRQMQIETIKKIRRIYQKPVSELLDAVIWRYEVQNIKAIIRGITQRRPEDMIKSAMIPTGLVSEAILNSLAELDNLEQLVGRVAIFGLPYAAVILREYKGQAKPVQQKMEVALEKWYFDQANATLHKESKQYKNLQRALSFEADLTNLLTALRFIGQNTKAQKGDWLPTGEIPFRSLQKISASRNLEQALQYIYVQPFSKALTFALREYQLYTNLSDLEKILYQARVDWYLHLMREDPLGIGVPLGFLVLKSNEIRNLSWIGKAVHFQFPVETIRQNLEFAS